MRRLSTVVSVAPLGLVPSGCGIPVAMVLRWDRAVPWDTSTVIVRAIRDYLTHDLPAHTAAGDGDG